MPTGTVTKPAVTLSDYETLPVTMQFTEPTANLAVSATYELQPLGSTNFYDYTTQGGSVEVDVFETARAFVKRDIPTLLTGFAVDTKARQNFLVSAIETTTDKTNCTTSIGSRDSIGSFNIFDSKWPIERITGTVALTERGFLATLPQLPAPVVLSVYTDILVNGPALFGGGFLWTLAPGEVTNIAMGYATNGGNAIETTIGSTTYRNEFSSCLKHLILGKEFGGNYLAVGFNESIEQPASQRAYIQTYPPRSSDIDRPYRGGARQQRNLQFLREGIKGNERQTFRAFLSCQEYWLWIPELNAYRPIELSPQSAFDDATSELTVNVTINAY